MTVPETQTSTTELVAGEIRAHLARQRMTGRALARTLGEANTTVSRWVNGAQPLNVDQLARVAAALGVSVADLWPTVTECPRRDSNAQPTDYKVEGRFDDVTECPPSVMSSVAGRWRTVIRSGMVWHDLGAGHDGTASCVASRARRRHRG